jgi:hypothetical protein
VSPPLNETVTFAIEEHAPEVPVTVYVIVEVGVEVTVAPVATDK